MKAIWITSVLKTGNPRCIESWAPTCCTLLTTHTKSIFQTFSLLRLQNNHISLTCPQCQQDCCESYTGETKQLLVKRKTEELPRRATTLLSTPPAPTLDSNNDDVHILARKQCWFGKSKRPRKGTTIIFEKRYSRHQTDCLCKKLIISNMSFLGNVRVWMWGWNIACTTLNAGWGCFIFLSDRNRSLTESTRHMYELVSAELCNESWEVP